MFCKKKRVGEVHVLYVLYVNLLTVFKLVIIHHQSTCKMQLQAREPVLILPTAMVCTCRYNDCDRRVWSWF